MSRVVYFPISDQNLKNFTRRVIKPKDCVINALQLIGLVDANHAELMRILVGEDGVMLDKVESIFNFFGKKSTYVFKKYYSKDPNDVANVQNIIDQLPPGICLFAGLKHKSGNKHVFILGKYNNGSYVVIDPQQKEMFQDLSKYLSYAEYLYILHKVPKQSSK
jgi:hypothetical protein